MKIRDPKVVFICRQASPTVIMCIESSSVRIARQFSFSLNDLRWTTMTTEQCT